MGKDKIQQRKRQERNCPLHFNKTNMTPMENTTNAAPKCLSDIDIRELSFIEGELNVAGLASTVAFYAVIFAVGVLASWRNRRQQAQSKTNDVMLAGRQMNEFIGVCTITATWVGGDYVNGTAEFIANPMYGLVWCLAPFVFSLALAFNGLVFAKKMWNAGYVTMLDPFEQKYGKVQTAFLYIATLFAECSFGAICFAVLGATLNVMIGISYFWAVITSAIVALLYTAIGGLSSVAYTDVVQLGGVLFGLFLGIPFAIRHPAVSSIKETARSNTTSWLGEAPEGVWISAYIDFALLMFFGAVPWQIFFQRVLSQKSAEKARYLSVIGAFVCMLCGLPAIVMGAIASSTDWNATGYREVGSIPMPECDYPLVLPLVMRFLTPVAVGVIGLGAVSAAVMSSSDSIILSSSSMFAYNVYRPIRNALAWRFGHNKKMASDTEVVWVLRGAMVFVAAIPAVMAITVRSIVALLMLAADIPYCTLFPQLVCVIHLPFANAYGSFFGYVAGLFFRLSAGEPLLRIPPLIKYPWYDEELQMQMFPAKTLASLISFAVIIGVSLVTRELARRSQWFLALDRSLFHSFSTRNDVMAQNTRKQPMSAKYTLAEVEEHDVEGFPVQVTNVKRL